MKAILMIMMVLMVSMSACEFSNEIDPKNVPPPPSLKQTTDIDPKNVPKP